MEAAVERAEEQVVVFVVVVAVVVAVEFQMQIVNGLFKLTKAMNTSSNWLGKWALTPTLLVASFEYG